MAYAARAISVSQIFALQVINTLFKGYLRFVAAIPPSLISYLSLGSYIK
jgi:hypothetical protein